VETAKGRLINQNPKAKGMAFYLQSSFYVDDSFFVFQDRNELCDAVQVLNKHFSQFGLIMHLGSSTPVEIRSDVLPSLIKDLMT
jgi:hypothetical protein